ncbi:MAG: DNA polymerase III subunit delta [Anaerolineae bacterium]|nr:DNA polymerase III subunit delta [Anaerolineae bacterium]
MLRLFYGDDRVSLDAEVARHVASGGRSAVVMNVVRLDGSVVDLEELASICCSLPFFGGTRVVVVRDLMERLRSASKQERSALLAALQHMPASTELLVVEPDLHREPESHPLHELAQRQGEVRAFSLTTEGDVEGWIERRAAALGVRLGRDAAAELHRRVGDSAVALEAELEKLAAFSLDAGPVQVQDVRELVVASPESSVFDLVEAIGRRETGRALARLEDLLIRQTESALALLGMVSRQFRLLLMAKDLVEARTSQAALAQELSVPPWLVNRFVAQSRLFTMAELEQALEKALRADYALKGGTNASEAAVLTQLVVELTGSGE